MDDVTLADETRRLGTLSLEGPAAAAIVSELTGMDLNSLGRTPKARRQHRAIPCTIIRRSTRKNYGG